jgi:uncharacterized protein YkwD
MRQLCPHLRLLAALVSIGAVALLTPSTAFAVKACESANATPAKASHRIVIRATLCVLNAARERHGLHSLRLNRRLSRAATRHAWDMARRKYFSHDTLGGGSFLDRIRHTGYLHGAHRWMVGENLAWATADQSAPRGVTVMWMNSPGHRANILNPTFREIGIGIVTAAPVRGIRVPAATYATDFGAKG